MERPPGSDQESGGPKITEVIDMTILPRRSEWEDRLAEWGNVFPLREDAFPLVNVHAEWMAALELALQELRETDQQLSDPDRADVLTHVRALLNSLGSVGQP